MLSAVALLAALAAAPASPSPQASPGTLPVIAHVRSSTFCDAFREAVLPSVAAILTNNAILNRSLGLYGKMNGDAAAGAAIGLDEMHLDRGVHAMAGNLILLGGLAAQLQQRIRTTASASDAKQLAIIHDRIDAIQQEQNAQLNVVGGLLATQQLAELEEKGESLTSVTMPEAGGKHDPKTGFVTIGTPSPNPGPAAIESAGLSRSPADRDSAQSLVQQTQLGANAYAEALEEIPAKQLSLDANENMLASEIRDAATSCNLLRRPAASP